MESLPSPAGPAIPTEVRRLVGTVGVPRTFTVTVEAVQAFLRATAGPGQDRSLATQDPDGPVEVPPTFFCPDPVIACQAMGLPRPRLLDRTIDGGSEWELHQPVRVGDVLTLVPHIAEVYSRTRADGSLLVVTVFELQCWNARGIPVGTARGRSVSLEERRVPCPA